MKIRSLSENRKLSLENDGELSLFFIGVGSAFSKKHYQNNIVIIKGEDHILVDCGTKTPQALHILGPGVTGIHNLVVTHSHADHVGGLEELILLHRYFTHRKPFIYIPPVYSTMLWENSLKGGAAFNERHKDRYLVFSDMFEVVEPVLLPDWPRETYHTQVGSIDIKMFRTMHIPDSSASWQDSAWSCGLVIDDRVMFTSDTRYDEGLISDYASRFTLDAVFHDCQFYTGGVHAGIDEIAALPDETKARTWLMHYGDDWKRHQKKVRRLGFAGLVRQWHYHDV